MESVCVEHYVALLPYKPKRWVTCHQLQTLEDAILLMEVYSICRTKPAFISEKLPKTGRLSQSGQSLMKGEFLASSEYP